MKNIFSLLVMVALFCLPASAQKDENNRIENAGKVMVAILNVPDDIPQDLLDKAECAIVLPSVMKAAFIVGGSYGRGVMTCRSGPDFSGHKELRVAPRPASVAGEPYPGKQLPSMKIHVRLPTVMGGAENFNAPIVLAAFDTN